MSLCPGESREEKHFPEGLVLVATMTSMDSNVVGLSGSGSCLGVGRLWCGAILSRKDCQNLLGVLEAGGSLVYKQPAILGEHIGMPGTPRDHPTGSCSTSGVGAVNILPTLLTRKPRQEGQVTCPNTAFLEGALLGWWRQTTVCSPEGTAIPLSQLASGAGLLCPGSSLSIRIL